MRGTQARSSLLMICPDVSVGIEVRWGLCVCACACVCVSACCDFRLCSHWGGWGSTVNSHTSWELLVLCPPSSPQALPGLLCISRRSSETNTGCFFPSTHGPGLASTRRNTPHPATLPAVAISAEISIKVFAETSWGETLSAGRIYETGIAGGHLATVGGEPRQGIKRV